MSNRGMTGQALNGLIIRENFGYEPHADAGAELCSVARCDAGRFLTTMLLSVQRGVRTKRCIGWAPDTEDATFLFSFAIHTEKALKSAGLRVESATL